VTSLKAEAQTAVTKMAARRAVHQAIKAGRLIRPEICEDCGQLPRLDRWWTEDLGFHFKRAPLLAHHWSYLPEHYLDVEWLCSECHGKRHRNTEEAKAAREFRRLMALPLGGVA
jgi:hypothetical protein